MTQVRRNSAWDLPEIEGFLNDCVIPIRLACLQAPDRPLVCSLWFLYDDGAFWCATQANARIVEFLQQQPACGFEIAPEAMPYRGVRGQGIAILDKEQGMQTLLRLLDRYLHTRESAFAQWLIGQADQEVAIRIQPEWLTAWDFGGRMRQ